MKYTVVWKAEAEEELARIWLDSPDRGLVSDAAKVLDRELAKNPFDAGESRPHFQRIAYCMPLGIRFEIIEDDRLVRVLAVWQCRHLKK